jgi:putative ABC transport system permease protein
MQIVGFIALTVASVGIITTLHTSVMERIRETGLLKALGYKNRLILTLFLDEATIIGIIGGTIGILYGIVLAQFISVFFARAWSIGGLLSVSIVPTFSVENSIFAWVLCVFLSIASGLYPAWRASKVAPVAALRHI